MPAAGSSSSRRSSTRDRGVSGEVEHTAVPIIESAVRP